MVHSSTAVLAWVFLAALLSTGAAPLSSDVMGGLSEYDANEASRAIGGREASESIGAKPVEFILFTTQRSGSTWTCDILRHIPGIKCGVEQPAGVSTSTPDKPLSVSELMIRYSYMKKRAVGNQYFTYANVTFEAWREDFNAALEKLRAEAAVCKAHVHTHVYRWAPPHSSDAPGLTSVFSLSHSLRLFCLPSQREAAATNASCSAMGFKLMYDQVPPRLHGDLNDFLARSGVYVVHLVREAQLLRYASKAQSGKGAMHSTSKERAEELKHRYLCVVPCSLSHFIVG